MMKGLGPTRRGVPRTAPQGEAVRAFPEHGRTRRRRPATCRRHRGTAMPELVLVLPLLMLILSLVFYVGRVVVRTQHAQVMARYETWRDVSNAPGPSSQGDAEHHQLNSAFFAGQADYVHWQVNDRAYVRQALDETIARAQTHSAEAERLADAILYRPPSETPRRRHGHREGFKAQYSTGVPLWQRLDGPFHRRHVLMDGDWRWVFDWRASADAWSGSGGPTPHHPRGVRDAFFADFDGELDALDGDTTAEYGDWADSPQRYDADILAGFIRSLYLREPNYRGPIVHDERP